MSIALGGCLKPEPVAYGITEDTGGHITYVLGEMEALGRHREVSAAEIVTRRFDAPQLGTAHARDRQMVSPGCWITRIDSGNSAYLAKEELARDRDAFTAALIAELEQRASLPDLIHAHFADAADVASAIRDRFGIPFVYTAHSLGIDKREVCSRSPALEARIEEETRAVRSADAIVASSLDECERQIPAYRGARFDRIQRLRPGARLPLLDGTELHSAQALAAPFLRDPTKPIVLAIARPVEKKNLAGLIRAFGKDENLKKRCNLVLLAGLRDGIDGGEPEQRRVLRELTDLIDRYDLHGSVAYPRRHTRKQVAGFYEWARESGGLFVNPALTEPYGLTLVEAASHGVPVVATRNGGPVDIVADLRHGELVDPHDDSQIAEAIRRLIEDRNAWRTASANALARIGRMDWDAYAAGFVSLAHDILTVARSPRKNGATDRLLVCDIDNTLTGCETGARRFSAHCRRQPKLAFGVATGRSIIEAQRIRREWQLPQPRVWITSVGSEIYWPTADGLALDRDYADRIAEDWQPKAVEKLLASIPGLDAQPAYEQRAFKRSYFASDPSVVDRVRSALAPLTGKVRIVFSHDRLVDILPAKAGKSAAVAHCAAVLNIAADRVAVAGDSGNDLDMLTDCPNAILVGNHAPELMPLRRRDNVYVARRHHAAGTLEGVLVWHRRDRLRARGTST